MKLTEIERLILSQQCRILESLYPKEAKFIAENRAAIDGGYTLHYGEMTEGLLPEMSEEDCKEVLGIMVMFQSLLRTYDVLADKSGIREYDIRFSGFDGNDNGDGGRLGYVRFLVEVQGKFKDLVEGATDSFNSHKSNLEQYRAMHDEWKKSENKHQLSKEDMIRIVAAGAGA